MFILMRRVWPSYNSYVQNYKISPLWSKGTELHLSLYGNVVCVLKKNNMYINETNIKCIQVMKYNCIV